MRLGRAADIWHKGALSAPVAFAVPALVLLAAGRLDLALSTSAGALCILYGHAQPYAARARTLAWVVLGMAASMGAALLTAALTGDGAVRIAVAALLAAVHKTVCDATRIGPPANVIFTFTAASCAFLPVTLGAIPGHLALCLAGGAVAWLVGMAPCLVRPEGPQRIATARALEAVARLARAQPGTPAGARARHDAAAAINAAWGTLFRVGARTPARAASRLALERLVVHAETAVAGAPADPVRLAAWARGLRKGRPLPVPPAAAPGGADPDELAGVAADRAASLARPAPTAARLRRPSPAAARGVRAVAAALRPGSPLLPIGARVAVGGALAGWASLALGVGRPYWAVVTAAAVFQANISLTWRRALQRAVGNLAGLALFTALLPITRTGQLALVLAVMAFQFAAEATMARNYWLGSVFVTPMALLMIEFAGAGPARTLVADRWLDTCVGAAFGLLSCAVVTNRRATGRIGAALDRLADATDAARALGRAAAPDPLEAGWARDRVATALVELREAVDVASGEWWQGALPEERVERAEREGHRVLASLALDPARTAGTPAAGP
ncbi:FUSC family protein [Actinomadura sp. J1-007]|nr:FUSC family protein [Actinomadura sp. J1-007]